LQSSNLESLAQRTWRI